MEAASTGRQQLGMYLPIAALVREVLKELSRCRRVALQAILMVILA